MIDETTWALSSGAGIGVAVIDTGISYFQENLDNDLDFVDGLSLLGRTEKRLNFLNERVSSKGDIVSLIDKTYAHDYCGHGTKMAGLIAAPRGTDGNVSGIAYNCNLYNYRAAHDVFLDLATERIAVASSLIDAALNTDIKIISMSLGQPPWANQEAVKIGLTIADSNGKLMVAAAGTGAKINYVGFPASSELTLALTGIQIPNDWPNALFNDINFPDFLLEDVCDICFYGEEVNFAYIMQHDLVSNRVGVAVTCDGDTPSFISGSSTATASFAGIAALVWSRLGSNTSKDVVEMRLEDNASNDNDPHPHLGKGWVNVYNALQ